MSKQHEVVINLNEYVTYEQKLEVVESLMELLDLDYEREDNLIRLRRNNEDLLHLVMEEFDRTHKK